MALIRGKATVAWKCWSNPSSTGWRQSSNTKRTSHQLVVNSPILLCLSFLSTYSDHKEPLALLCSTARNPFFGLHMISKDATFWGTWLKTLFNEFNLVTTKVAEKVLQLALSNSWPPDWLAGTLTTVQQPRHQASLNYKMTKSDSLGL